MLLLLLLLLLLLVFLIFHSQFGSLGVWEFRSNSRKKKNRGRYRASKLGNWIFVVLLPFVIIVIIVIIVVGIIVIVVIIVVIVGIHVYNLLIPPFLIYEKLLILCYEEKFC